MGVKLYCGQKKKKRLKSRQKKNIQIADVESRRVGEHIFLLFLLFVIDLTAVSAPAFVSIVGARPVKSINSGAHGSGRGGHCVVSLGLGRVEGVENIYCDRQDLGLGRIGGAARSCK